MDVQILTDVSYITVQFKQMSPLNIEHSQITSYKMSYIIQIWLLQSDRKSCGKRDPER